MSDTKARRVMRGNLYQVDEYEYEFARSDNGTHMLVPVEVLEMVVKKAFLEGHRAGCSAVSHLFGEEDWLVSNTHRALAEIGGE